jgi:hypothetical protein
MLVVSTARDGRGRGPKRFGAGGLLCALALGASMTLWAAPVSVASAASLEPAKAPARPRPPKDFRAASGAQAGFRITRTEVERYGRLLNLAPEQLEAALGIASAYEKTTTELSREVNERTRAFWADYQKKVEEQQKRAEAGGEFKPVEFDRDGLNKLSEMQFAVGEKVADAEVKFMDDLKALLRPEQEAKWVRVERADRRATILRGLGQGMPISSASLDVVSLVDQLKFDAATSAKIEARLEKYEAEIDPPLLRIKEVYEDLVSNEKRFREMQAAQEAGDMKAVAKPMNEFFDAARRLRDVNRRTLRDLVAELNGPEGDRLGDEYRRRAFPMMASFTGRSMSSHLVRCFEAAMKFDDLTDQQRSSLVSMRAAYYRDRRVLMEKMEGEMVVMEDEIKFETMMENPSESPMMKAMKMLQELPPKLEEIDKRVLPAMKAVLNSEQAGRLPAEPTDTGPRFPMGMPGGGGEPGEPGEDQR